MQDVHLRFFLLPGTEDPQITDMGYQAELTTFTHSLERAGVKVVARQYMPPMKPGIIYNTLHGFLGEYGLPLAQVGIPAIGAALAAWIVARGNRRVKVKLADIEVEARTPKEVEDLLQQLLQAKQQVESKLEVKD